MSVRSLDAAQLLPVPLARRLRDTGLRWEPTAGDRFVLADRDMDADVFVVSDMVADVHQFPSGPVIGFNGTVEWALDSVGTEQTLWLPQEDQLRRLLGGTFRRLERDGGPRRRGVGRHHRAPRRGAGADRPRRHRGRGVRPGAAPPARARRRLSRPPGLLVTRMLLRACSRRRRPAPTLQG